MVEFWDEGEHQRDHEAFKKWQRRNRCGNVLNFPVNEATMFYKSGCPHIRDFSKVHVSLTENRKLCSSDGGELTAYAREQSIDWERCDTCGQKSHAQLWRWSLRENSPMGSQPAWLSSEVSRH
jgi:hypothetical protein